MLEAELVQPGDEAVEAVLGDGQLGQRPAEHDVDPVLAVAGQLGVEVAGGHRRSPAELDHVDVLTGHLGQAIDARHREPAVEHMGDSLLARLAGPFGQAEQVLHRHGRLYGGTCGEAH